jgi:hypothetical protein
VQNLLNELVGAGISVQLLHTTTETSWEDMDVHGYVLFRNTAGQEIIRKGGFQHNRNLRKGGAWDASAVQQLCEKVTVAIKESSPPAKVSGMPTEEAAIAATAA